jgi:hypothetical protein
MTMNVQLRRDTNGRLVAIDEAGGVHTGVEPVRAFPITDPDAWIALVDAQGHEVMTITNPADLSHESHELLLQELAAREFLPRIEKVIRVSDHRDPQHWHVVTDRGRVEFLLRNTDDIRRLGPHRAILVDMHGVRYYIPNSQQLDAASQRILSRYL